LDNAKALNVEAEPSLDFVVHSHNEEVRRYRRRMAPVSGALAHQLPAKKHEQISEKDWQQLGHLPFKKSARRIFENMQSLCNQPQRGCDLGTRFEIDSVNSVLSKSAVFVRLRDDKASGETWATRLWQFVHVEQPKKAG
jgi:hypothetical protein